MYEIIKHVAKQTTTLFTSPCESMARARFTKSASLLKLNETLELWHEGQLIDSVSKSLPKDEDGQIIFPEAASALETRMKSLYCIAGILPAQFRSSRVDCGIGWKEHVKQEPRKAKAENGMSEIKEQLKEVIKLNAEIEAFIQESTTICQGYQPPLNQPPVWIGIDPAAEPKPSIDLSTIKPGDKVMLVDGETSKYSWARGFTKNKVYEVCETDFHPGKTMNIRLTDDRGAKLWVYTTDVRPIGFNPATKTWTVDDMSKLDYTKVKVGDKLVFADTEANRQHAPYGTQSGLIYTVHAFEEDRLILCLDEL